MQLATSIPPVVEWTSFHFENLRTEKRDKFSGACETQTLKLILTIHTAHTQIFVFLHAPVHLCIFIMCDLSGPAVQKQTTSASVCRSRSEVTTVYCEQGLLLHRPPIQHPSFNLSLVLEDNPFMSGLLEVHPLPHQLSSDCVFSVRNK